MEQGMNPEAEDRRCVGQELPGRRCVGQELPGRRCEAQGVYLDRFWRKGWVCQEHMPEYTVSIGMAELMQENVFKPWE